MNYDCNHDCDALWEAMDNTIERFYSMTLRRISDYCVNGEIRIKPNEFVKELNNVKSELKQTKGESENE